DRDRDRGGRGRDRDRGERRFDRDRGPREDRGERNEARNDARSEAPAVEPVTETAPPSASEAPAAKVDDVARAALDRGGKGRDKKRSEPTEATREFWETWADNKSSKTEAPAAAPVKAEAAPAEEVSDNEETHDEPKGRSRGSRGGRGRGKKDDAKRETKAAPKKHDDKPADDKPAAKAEAPAGRAKRDTVVTPSPEGSQARLFVSLGKKHGVTADDLRSLLAGPIGGDTARIGSVSLRDSHAHVRVPEELVDAIIAGVHGTQHNDHDVTVERSRA
ncbi:MAG TPA: DbpA RNA binding domain-containing protein, partial [Kofleriaceae bacterium]